MATYPKESPDGFLKVSPDGGYSVEFERDYDQSIKEVWATMTEPSRVIDWYADADIDPREGGKIELRFANSGVVAHGIVTEYEPPGRTAVFEHMWITGQQSEPSQPMPERLAAGNGTCGDLTLAASVIRYALTATPEGGTSLKLSHYVPLNPRLIPSPLTRSAKTATSHVSETPAPDMVLATWETLLGLLDGALNKPGNRAMSLTGDRSGEWPWDSFDELRQKYTQSIR